jgi:hypothetical protein
MTTTLRSNYLQTTELTITQMNNKTHQTKFYSQIIIQNRVKKSLI